MSKPVVVVFTANSNTGSAAIEALLADYSAQVSVRAVVRSKEAEAEVAEQFGDKVEIVIGDIAKKQMLGPVFAGANAAYFATPSTKDRAKLVSYFVDACMEHGVEYGVLLSYIGSEAPVTSESTTYHKQFSEIEAYAASKAGQPVKLPIADRGHKKFAPIVVRSCPFYQNFYGCLSSIKEGTLYYPLETEALVHVDYSDVGKVIALVLSDPEPHSGNSYNIIGESQPGNMIASNIAMKAGLECSYEDVDDEIAVAAFKGLGLQSWIAEGNVEMLKYIRQGGMAKYGAGDFEALTGNKPMRFGQFVKDYLKPMLV